MSEMIFLMLLIVGIPALLGFSMARRRGRNPYLWGILAGIFPFFLVLLATRHRPRDSQSDAHPTRLKR